MVAVVYAVFATTLAHFAQEDTDKFDAEHTLKQPTLKREGWVQVGDLYMRMRPDGRAEMSDKAGFRIVNIDSLTEWQMRALTRAEQQPRRADK